MTAHNRLTATSRIIDLLITGIHLFSSLNVLLHTRPEDTKTAIQMMYVTAVASSSGVTIIDKKKTMPEMIVIKFFIILFFLIV